MEQRCQNLKGKKIKPETRGRKRMRTFRGGRSWDNPQSQMLPESGHTLCRAPTEVSMNKETIRTQNWRTDGRLASGNSD